MMGWTCSLGEETKATNIWKTRRWVNGSVLGSLISNVELLGSITSMLQVTYFCLAERLCCIETGKKQAMFWYSGVIMTLWIIWHRQYYMLYIYVSYKTIFSSHLLPTCLSVTVMRPCKRLCIKPAMYIHFSLISRKLYLVYFIKQCIWCLQDITALLHYSE